MTDAPRVDPPADRRAGPHVSVVMAVFNARDTIVRAVASVLDQTVADLELVLVDDGSTDGSLDVVRAWLALDRPDEDRVRCVVRPTNGGAAAARNTGVDEARGEFVCFVDSDDEFLPHYLQTLTAHAVADVDIVVGNVVYVRLDGSRSERRPRVTGTFSGRVAARLGLTDRITPFTCDKLIRRKLYAEVRYPEGIINEDFLANPVLAAHARAVSVVDAPVYLYRLRPSSVTWGATPPASDLDIAAAYLRQALPGEAQAIEHAMVFLAMSTAQRAMLRSSATSQEREVIAACRRRIRVTRLPHIARSGPVTAEGALLL